MVSHNNPAGRLYDLLGQFRDAARSSIVDAWAQILGEPPELVRQRLSSVTQLVSQIEVAVSPPDRQTIAASVRRYRGEWLEAIFPLRHSFDAAARDVKPSDPAYEALGAVAAYLEAVAPEGEIPSEEQRSKLMEKLQTIIDEVSGADDLPKDIAHLVLSRLADVQTAMRHIEIGGPDAVRLATEALIGVVVTSSTEEKNRKANTTKHVLRVAGAIWVAFSSGPMVQNSIEAWPEVVHELTTGSEQVAGGAAHQAGKGSDASPQPAEHGDQTTEAAR